MKSTDNVDLNITAPFIRKDQFSDGVIFCRLIQKLDRINQIPGFQPFPKSSAQKTNNIRRFLEYLVDNKNKISLSIIVGCEDALRNGDLVQTFNLLAKIRKLYKIN
jgi:hypothetical protein